MQIFGYLIYKRVIGKKIGGKNFRLEYKNLRTIIYDHMNSYLVTQFIYYINATKLKPTIFKNIKACQEKVSREI